MSNHDSTTTRKVCNLRHLSDAILAELATLEPTIRKATVFDTYYNRERTAWEVVPPAELTDDPLFDRVAWWGFRTRKEAQAGWETDLTNIHGAVTGASTDCIPDSGWLNDVLDRHDPDGLVARDFY